MVLVGAHKIQILKERVKDQTFDGVTFHVEKIEGLMAYLSHDAESDEKAAGIIKKLIKEMPEFYGKYVNVRTMDSGGTIV